MERDTKETERLILISEYFYVKEIWSYSIPFYFLVLLNIFYYLAHTPLPAGVYQLNKRREDTICSSS